MRTIRIDAQGMNGMGRMHSGGGGMGMGMPMNGASVGIRTGGMGLGTGMMADPTIPLRTGRRSPERDWRGRSRRSRSRFAPRQQYRFPGCIARVQVQHAAKHGPINFDCRPSRAFRVLLHAQMDLSQGFDTNGKPLTEMVDVQEPQPESPQVPPRPQPKPQQRPVRARRQQCCSRP